MSIEVPVTSQITRRWSLMFSLLCSGLVPVFLGCRHEADEAFSRVPVAGTVTLDGAPLDEAIIRFIPTGQTPGPKTVFPISGGTFTATRHNGPPVGSHRVEIRLADEGEFAHDDEQALAKFRQMPRHKRPRQPLPQKYHARSLLTAELFEPSDGEAQSLEFSLSSQSQ